METKYHVILWRLYIIEEHGVAHTTFVLEVDCLASKWHITRFLPNSTKRSWAMDAITWTLCNGKVKIGKYGTPTPAYKGLKKEICSTNNVEYTLWFFYNDIKHCISGNKKYLLDWPIVLNTWPEKIGTKLCREEDTIY
jgi:hypothetical protein